MKITPETFRNIYIYSPTKGKYHLTCFNNIFSNNELISNKKKYIDKNIGWCLTFVGVYIYICIRFITVIKKVNIQAV